MNAIVAIAVGEDYKKLADVTHPAMKDYAKKIGADFICISESFSSSPHWEKFDIYNLLVLCGYSRVLYLDTDILIKPDAPNIFDVVPEHELGIFDENPFTDGTGIKSITESCLNYGIDLKNWNHKYYNTGVMVVPRSWANIFKKPEREIHSYFEQGYLNAVIHNEIQKGELKVFELSHEFNRTYQVCKNINLNEEPRIGAHFIHYAGFANPQHVIDLINQDKFRMVKSRVKKGLMEKCLWNKILVDQSMKINGFLYEEDLYRMIEIMDSCCPKSDEPIAEIGVYAGRATNILQQYGHVICVDTSIQPEFHRASIEHLFDAEFWSNQSRLAAGFAKNKGMKFKAVFIDADHSYESVLEDITLWKEVLIPGGLIFGDDFIAMFPGVEKAVTESFGDRFKRTPHGKLWYVTI